MSEMGEEIVFFIQLSNIFYSCRKLKRSLNIKCKVKKKEIIYEKEHISNQQREGYQ